MRIIRKAVAEVGNREYRDRGRIARAKQVPAIKEAADRTRCSIKRSTMRLDPLILPIESSSIQVARMPGSKFIAV